MPHNYLWDSYGCVDRRALIIVALCISKGSQWCLGMRPYEVGYITSHPIIGHQYNWWVYHISQHWWYLICMQSAFDMITPDHDSGDLGAALFSRLCQKDSLCYQMELRPLLPSQQCCDLILWSDCCFVPYPNLLSSLETRLWNSVVYVIGGFHLRADSTLNQGSMSAGEADKTYLLCHWLWPKSGNQYQWGQLPYFRIKRQWYHPMSCRNCPLDY